MPSGCCKQSSVFELGQGAGELKASHRWDREESSGLELDQFKCGSLTSGGTLSSLLLWGMHRSESPAPCNSSTVCDEKYG
jgi:hypothetical protein